MDKRLNNIELNCILYYADYLSLKHTGLPVTDNCKYYFIYGFPINCSYIVDLEPFYDEDNEYYKQSASEYNTIRDKFGDDGISSFLGDLCSLSAIGCVSGVDMLKCINRFNTRSEKKNAINKYNKYMNSLTYSHDTKDDEMKTIRENCSKHIAHFEKAHNINNPKLEEHGKN